VNHAGSNSIDNCIKSLRLLDANYLRDFPAPVILFHEAGLTEAMKNKLVSCLTQFPTFVELTFNVPTHITYVTNVWRVGYMHMCRFFAFEIFKQPILKEFEYYCRLDTDSYVMSKVKEDIFKAAKFHNLHYGFIDDSIVDQPEFTVDLWPTAERYINARPELKIYAKLYRDIPERRLYYNNFELCYLPWFRQEPWTGYADFIDKAGGIYAYRWGDHIIRYIGVRSFMPPQHIQRITSVHYKHDMIEANK
jgi:hypothetical protein